MSATGTVTPVQQVQISSQVSGQIRELLVDFNSPVREGQLIAQLDPQTFEYRMRQASADVEAANASVLTAQANVQSALAQVARAQGDAAEAQRAERRKQGLLAQEFISAAELDAARSKAASLAAALRVAQAQVDVARAQEKNAMAIVRQREAQLQQSRVDLQRTQIRSPVDGVVIKRSVEVGQTVAVGDRLMVLEAMKMKTPVIATRAGQVTRVLVAPGDAVEGGDRVGGVLLEDEQQYVLRAGELADAKSQLQGQVMLAP